MCTKHRTDLLISREKFTKKQSALTTSRFQQFSGKPHRHKDDSSNVDKHANSHRQYHHEQPDKVKVYHVSVAILGRVDEQLRVDDCSHDRQQVIA